MTFQRLSIDRNDHSNFLKLPHEIKDEIYALCLITNFEIVMHPKTYEISGVPDFGIHDQPCVALLQLNPQVYSETFLTYLPSVSTYHALYSSGTDNEDSGSGFEFEED